MVNAARRRRDSDPLATFLHYLMELERAVLGRDAMQITSLLRKRTATHLPRAVREELLALSRMSRDTLRAPVQFLRFQHRMTQLAAGGEPLPTAQTELRLESRPPAGSVRVRELQAASNPCDNDDDDGESTVEPRDGSTA